MRHSSTLGLCVWVAQIVCSNGFAVRPQTCNPLGTTNFPTVPRVLDHSNKQPLFALSDENSSPGKKSSIRTFVSRILSRRRIRRGAAVLMAAVFWSTARPAAHAKFSYELNETPTHSLRPGMSKNQADRLDEGELDVSELESASIFQQPTESAAAESKQKQSSFGYGEEEDDDDFFLEEDESGAASQADQATAEKLQARTTKEFAAYQQGKSKSLTIKVGLCFFVPTYGFMIVREYVRRRREETYVQKGLEILEAQKAEYFNVTAKSDDSDVEDELKGLKNNSTSTDDDDTDEDKDDDDDDSEDDDEPPKPSRRSGKPKRPSGDGGGDEGGDPGYGKPSDEDLDRLNKMFGKS